MSPKLRAPLPGPLRASALAGALGATLALALPAAGAAALAEAAKIGGEIPITSRSPEAVALLRAGRDKALNFQPAAAIEFLTKALALDPEFALATAWLARCKSGEAALELAEKAVRLSASLPPTERLLIETLRAEKRGDDEAQRRLKRELADLAPADWFAQFQLGVQSQYDHKSQAALIYLNRAVKLNPELAEAYNYLGFVLAQQGMHEEGVAAARKFVELKPTEPNSYDALGEVLLLVGRLDEAEAQFHHALELDPRLWMASAGVAYVRAFRGDFAGAREATARGRKAQLAPAERQALLLVDAWGWLAQGKPAEALEQVDGLEKEAAARKDDTAVAWAQLQRAEMDLELTRLDHARAQAASARERLARAPVGEEQIRVRRQLLIFDASLAAAARQPAAGGRAVAALEAELKSAPSNSDLRAALQYARGLQALAAREPARAADRFALCPEEAVRCRMRLAEAHDLAGEPRAAEEARAQLLAHGLRDALHRGQDPEYLYFRARLAAKR